jgi:hypothetical protein
MCLLLVACAPKTGQVQAGSTPSSTEPAGAGKTPVAIAELRARETKGLGELPVVAGDGTWRGALLAKTSPTVSKTEHGVYQVKADIGARSAMECSVFPTDISGGVWLSAVLDGARKSVQMLSVEPKGIEVVGNHVSMDVIATYTAELKSGKAIGEMKIYILSGSDRGFVCYHDELGYVSTFGTSARLFARSFELMHEPWQVEGVEINRAELDGHPVGFSQHYWVRMPNGVALTLSRTLVTHQRAPGELSTEDDLTVEGLGADSRIVNAQYHAWQGDTETYQIELAQKGKGVFTYQGKAHGKALSGSISTKDKKGLESAQLIENRIAEALKKKNPSTVKWETYLPDSDPTRLQLIEAKVIPKDRRMEARKDKQVSYEWLDEQGSTVRTVLDLGRVKLNVVRLVRKGR